MTVPGSHASIAKILSATYQAMLAEQRGGGDNASANAFLLEFDDHLEAIGRETSVEGVIRVFAQLLVEQMGALTAVVRYYNATTDIPVEQALPDLIRTYREAARRG